VLKLYLEGRKEGKKEGRKEGNREGRKEGRKEGRNLGTSNHLRVGPFPVHLHPSFKKV
jgi:flagellar biosynthesis/type III secretory pathway protein FliH